MHLNTPHVCLQTGCDFWRPTSLSPANQMMDRISQRVKSRGAESATLISGLPSSAEKHTAPSSQ